MPSRSILYSRKWCVVQFSVSDCIPEANSWGEYRIWREYNSTAGGMGATAARSLTLQRIQRFGSANLTHKSIYTRQLPGLQAVPALTRSNNINSRFVTARSNSANFWKSFNISKAMDSSSVTTNDFIVTRAGMKPSFGSPRANVKLGFSKGLASGISRDSESAASTSDSSAHQVEESRYSNNIL